MVKAEVRAMVLKRVSALTGDDHMPAGGAAAVWLLESFVGLPANPLPTQRRVGRGDVVATGRRRTRHAELS